MTDYQPLDLSSLCNAGPEILAGKNSPASGARTFHGLPFQIGGEAGKPCYLAFGSEAPWNAGAITVPIGQTARRLIFAHTMARTKVLEGEERGKPVASYVVKFANGERVET